MDTRLTQIIENFTKNVMKSKLRCTIFLSWFTQFPPYFKRANQKISTNYHFIVLTVSFLSLLST